MPPDAETAKAGERRASGTAATLHVWWKLALCLVVFAIWARYRYVPHQLSDFYDRPFPILRDRTGGQQLGVMFELMPLHAARADVLIALVGDSTVNSAEPDPKELPFLLQTELSHLLPNRRVEVIDLGLLGLSASDALFLTAEALAIHPSIVVYAMSPRTIPANPDAHWATDVADLALRWGVVSRVGLLTALEFVDPRALGRTIAYSSYPPLAIRLAIARTFWDKVFHFLPRAVAPLHDELIPPQPPVAPGVAIPLAGYQFTREKYHVDDSNRSVRAMDALVRMCGRSGGCLLYHVPVNPASAATGFEPGLVDAFADRVARDARSAGVPFRDYRTLATPERFKMSLRGTPDPIHLKPDAKPWFAAILARDIVTRLQERGS